jgi:hypothetical protein
MPLLLLIFACSGDSNLPIDDSDEPALVSDGAPGDPLVYESRSPTSTFWETTDVATKGNAVYTCTGVASFVVHNARKPSRLDVEKSLTFDGSDQIYPRCTHINVAGNRAVVTARKDEVQTQPFIALLNVDDAMDPLELDTLVIDTGLIEEAAIVQDHLWVAAAEDGLWRYDISADTIGSRTDVEVPGTVTRVARFGDGVAAGTNGQVHRVDAGGAVTSIDVDGQVQALLELPDGRLAVALGSAGIAIIDGTNVVATTDTHGTALRLDLLSSGELLVANWSDVRLYDITDSGFEVRAVDAVFEADDRPRHLAAAAQDNVVFAGEWTGLHALSFYDSESGPEFTPSSLTVAMPEDGEAFEGEITVTNEGSEELTVSNVDVDGGWSVTPATLSLAPGESSELVFAHGGSQTVDLRHAELTTNDPDEPLVEIQVRIGSNRVFVGDPAPDFSYTALNGTQQNYALEDQRGHVVMLSYFATF